MGEKPKLLFLDDRSKRLHAALKKYGEEYDVTLVCTVKECIKMLSNEGPWDVVSLDHDLDYEEFVPSLLPNTGMEVVRWLCENIDYMRMVNYGRDEVEERLLWFRIIIHTSNKAAAFRMETRLRDAGYNKIKCERFTYDD